MDCLMKSLTFLPSSFFDKNGYVLYYKSSIGTTERYTIIWFMEIPGPLVPADSPTILLGPSTRHIVKRTLKSLLLKDVKLNINEDLPKAHFCLIPLTY